MSNDETAYEPNYINQCSCSCHGMAQPVMCTCCYVNRPFPPPQHVNLPYKYDPIPRHVSVSDSEVIDRLTKIELQLEQLINKHKDCEK